VDSRTTSHTQSLLYPRSSCKAIACGFKYLNLYHQTISNTWFDSKNSWYAKKREITKRKKWHKNTTRQPHFNGKTNFAEHQALNLPQDTHHKLEPRKWTTSNATQESNPKDKVDFACGLATRSESWYTSQG